MSGEKPGVEEPDWDVGQYSYVPTHGSRWVNWIFGSLVELMGPNPLPEEDIMATEPLYEEEGRA